jgi:hypothetical protein
MMRSPVLYRSWLAACGWMPASVLMLLALVAGASGADKSDNERTADSAIRATAAAFVQAFNRGDAKAVASLWTANLANSGASADGSQDTPWLPLGVFGLTASGQKTPNMVFQLAVNKDGVIRGNYCDPASQTNLPVQGAVDKKTQRAAWNVGGNKAMVVETGLYNLTKDESTALVHDGAGKTQQYVLVRMKQPSQDQQQQ